MFLGVPIFACFYAGVRAYSAYRLTKKGLPVSSASYATHKPVWPSACSGYQDFSCGSLSGGTGESSGQTGLWVA